MHLFQSSIFTQKEGDRLITHTVNQADNIEQVAKKITLKGKIIDANTQEAIIGANIQVKGSNAGQISDIDGNFILNDIDANSTLIVSYIGYLHQEIPIKGKKLSYYSIERGYTNFK